MSRLEGCGGGRGEVVWETDDNVEPAHSTKTRTALTANRIINDSVVPNADRVPGRASDLERTLGKRPVIFVCIELLLRAVTR